MAGKTTRRPLKKHVSIKLDRLARMPDDSEEKRQVKKMVSSGLAQSANPGPLGLFGFSLTTFLLQGFHTRLTGDDPVSEHHTKNLVWGFGLFHGGFVQLLAGMWEMKRGNLFGATAFSSYGVFWMGLAFDYVLHEALDDYPFDKEAVQMMFCLWGLFTTALWLCTFRLNKTLCLLFFLLATLFFMLAAGVKDKTVDKAAGWIGMVTAAVAFWLGFAELVNEIYGNVIPLGKFETLAKHIEENVEHHIDDYGGFHAGGRHFRMAANIIHAQHQKHFHEDMDAAASYLDAMNQMEQGKGGGEKGNKVGPDTSVTVEEA
mmetsp:Transcript_6237/g.7157  ORF Transcript_6237/g.7157 Transcript_6237/m.7157 type:complete len:316 (+) Transcript_6237:105-1052(+)